MNEPERLNQRESSELPARLVRAGAAEVPSARSLERTLVALGAAATTLGSAGAAGALNAAASGAGGAFGTAASGKVASLTLLGLVKWAGTGIATGVAVSMVAHAVEPAPVRVSPSAAPHGDVVAPPVPEPRSEPTSATPAPVTEPSASIEAPRVIQGDANRDVRPTELLGAPLAAEVAFVDRGRSAFQRGDSKAALAALASYEREYPERRLLPEVLYLRLEALSASGEEARARELARRIVRDFAKSPHATRARALLGAP
jgi:TolA-binding protein